MYGGICNRGVVSGMNSGGPERNESADQGRIWGDFEPTVIRYLAVKRRYAPSVDYLGRGEPIKESIAYVPYSGNNKTPSLQYSGKHFAHTQILTERRRKALEMTDTLLKLIAKAAIMGLRRIPKNG